MSLYQIEYKSCCLPGCSSVEVERETLEEAKKFADYTYVYLGRKAKVRDMTTRCIVYEAKEREGSG